MALWIRDSKGLFCNMKGRPFYGHTNAGEEIVVEKVEHGDNELRRVGDDDAHKHIVVQG